MIMTVETHCRDIKSQYGPTDEESSPAHSSSSLVFSDDGSRETASSRSSVSSPPDSPSCPAQSISQSRGGFEVAWAGSGVAPAPGKVVPLEQRQNPRRTSCSSEARSAPPPLVRQSERKECFVACLVSFATQFVEAIWPLAACTPRTDTSFHGRGVLSLHSFITETLRRSRTSYSTLQVALFYLILIKECLPRTNFCSEQPRGNEQFRAMQCGRRMFLTALILASKYLQDRNYSTRAWSKISGLRAQEIHLNEMEYCKRINWALHFPKEKFDRWSYTVLRLSSPLSAQNSETVAQIVGWKTVLAKLNPGLTESFPSREDFKACQSLSTLVPSNFVFGDGGSDQRSSEATKTESSIAVPTKKTEVHPPQTCVISEPPQPRIAKLPTPQSTPHPNTINNFSNMSAASSMCAAMSHVRNQGLIRVTRDQCPPPQACPVRRCGSQSSSLSRVTSAAVSPSESYMSEPPPLVYSRGSRSSSISSSASVVSNSSLPPRLGKFASNGMNPLSRDYGSGSQYRSNDQYLTGMISDLRTCTSSPEAWEQQSTAASSPLVGKDAICSRLPAKQPSKEIQTDFSNEYPSSANVRFQDWEAAATLCQLPSNQTRAWLTPTTSSPARTELSRSVSASDYHDQLTPRANGAQVYRAETVSPSTCHKRTHSKSNDLQDQVRQHLRKAIWSTDMPDRTVSSTARKIPCQSPTQTFGIKQFPVPTKGSEGHKRYCAYQATAADRAASMLISDHLRQGPVR